MNNIELFERFQKSTLSEKERNDLEQKLLSDPELKKQYTFFKLAQDAIEEDIADELRNRFSEWSQSTTISESTPTSPSSHFTLPRLIKYSVAASIILLICSILTFNIMYDHQSTIDFSSYINSPHRGIESEMNSYYRQAYAYYIDKKFHQSENEINQIPQENPNYWDGQILKAIIFHETGKNKIAITTLEDVIRLLDPKEQKVRNNQSEWLLLQIMYRANGWTQDVERQARKISKKNGHLYQNKALQLLEQNSKWWNIFII